MEVVLDEKNQLIDKVSDLEKELALLRTKKSEVDA